MPQAYEESYMVIEPTKWEKHYQVVCVGTNCLGHQPGDIIDIFDTEAEALDFWAECAYAAPIP